MDILADPDDPDQWPLKLKVFKSQQRKRDQNPHPHDQTGLLCKFYCSKFDKFLVSDPLGPEEKTLDRLELEEITDLDTCYECIQEEVIDGILYHDGFEERKWFVIDREIPVMYPLELRDVKIERKFISRYPSECKELGITEPYRTD